MQLVVYSRAQGVFTACLGASQGLHGSPQEILGSSGHHSLFHACPAVQLVASSLVAVAGPAVPGASARAPPAKLDTALTKDNCLEELLSCLVLLIPGITAVTSTVTICSETDTLVPFKCKDRSHLLSPFFSLLFGNFQKRDGELEAQALDELSGVGNATFNC